MKSLTETIKNDGNVPASASLQKRAVAAARSLFSRPAATKNQAFLSKLEFFIDGTHHVATEWKNSARATAKPFRTEDVFQRTHFAAANAFVITLFDRVS